MSKKSNPTCRMCIYGGIEDRTDEINGLECKLVNASCAGPEACDMFFSCDLARIVLEKYRHVSGMMKHG